MEGIRTAKDARFECGRPFADFGGEGHDQQGVEKARSDTMSSGVIRRVTLNNSAPRRSLSSAPVSRLSRL